MKERGLGWAIWLAVVIGGYLALHRPLAAPQWAALGLAGARWLLGGVMVALAGGLGRRLWPQATVVRPPTAAVVQAALGLGGLALLAWGLAWLGGLQPWVLGLALIGLLVGLRRSVWAWLASWGEMRRWISQAGRLGRWAAGAMAFMALLSLVQALAPPLKFDALVYHLALPRQYLQQGHWGFVPNFFWGMPQLVEMLYTWAMGLLGAPAAVTLGWWVAWLLTLGVGLVAADWVGPRTGWVAALALLTGRTWWAIAAWGYVDQWVALFGLALLVLWTEARVTRRAQAAFWAGVAAGWAVGTKYTGATLGLLAGLGLLLEALWSRVRERVSHSQETVTRTSSPHSHHPLAIFLAFTLALTLTSAPWLLKNLWATGNPLYPFFFPAGVVDEFRIANYTGTPLPPLQVLLLPLLATWQGIEGSDGYAASIGPWLLALAPLAWLRRPRHPAWRPVTGLALGGLLVWALAALWDGYLAQARLHFGLFPAFALLAAWGWRNLETVRWQGRPLTRWATGLLALSVTLATLQYTALTIQRRAPAAVLGFIDEQTYLEHNLGWYARAMQAIRALPPDRRVLLLWEPRAYYCLPRCVPDEILDRFWHDLTLVPPADLPVLWRAQGYTDVLIYDAGVHFLRRHDPQRDWAALTPLVARLHLEASFGEAYTLYALP